MPRQPIEFVTGEFYHVFNRGIERRDIFGGDEDRLRLLNSFLVFNDTVEAPWGLRGLWSERESFVWYDYEQKEPLVEIHAFALMRNHFHLMLRQVRDRGISEFMRKSGGYTSYFNKKYQRVGPLFQGRFRCVHISTQDQLRNVFAYIHTNPVEIVEPNWKKEWIVRDKRKAIEFLDSYPWTSYIEYVKEENRYPNLLTVNFFQRLLGMSKGCREEVEGWIKAKAENAAAAEIGARE